MRSSLLLPLAATLLATACASAPQARSALDTSTVVLVDNQFVEDARVYLVRGSMPILLGTVGSFERRSFRLGPALLPVTADVRLRVRPLSGKAFISEPVMVHRGDRLEWRLAPSLKLSTLTVRR